MEWNERGAGRSAEHRMKKHEPKDARGVERGGVPHGPGPFLRGARFAIRYSGAVAARDAKRYSQRTQFIYCPTDVYLGPPYL